MPDLKSILYKQFDTEGIKVKAMFKMSLSFDIERNTSISKPSNTFIPINRFNISDGDYKQIIVEYINDTTSINIESVDNLDKYPSINGLPFLLKLNDLSEGDMAFYLAFGKIPGSITIREEHSIESLGNIEEINGDLGLISTSIKSLGKLRKVTGSFWIAQSTPSNLTDLGNLETVEKDLSLKGSPIRTLNKLRSVGGTLNLRKTDILSLGDLEFVGNHIYLPKTKKNVFDLSKLKISGKVKYFN